MEKIPKFNKRRASKKNVGHGTKCANLCQKTPRNLKIYVSQGFFFQNLINMEKYPKSINVGPTFIPY